MSSSFRLSALLLLFTTSFFAQTDTAKVWDLLLSNKRAEAIALTKKMKKDQDIDMLVTDAVVRRENGFIDKRDNFIDLLIKYPEYQNYLYALWNEDFVFTDYLDEGLKTHHEVILEKLNASDEKYHTTLANAMLYLDAIVKRHKNDWNGYHTSVGKINALSNWQYCGVFENMNKSGHDIQYPPESLAESKEDFNANSNGFVNWYTPERNKGEAYQFFHNHNEFGAGVSYAQTFINSEIDQRVVLRFGSGSALKVWLNDVQIVDNKEEATTEMDAFNVAVNLSKGMNRLLLKVSKTGGSGYFIARITDEKGDALTNYTDNSTVASYPKKTLKEIAPKALPNDFVRFFKEKVAQAPDSFLNNYLLFRALLRTSRYKEAKAIIESWEKKYPKSSLLRIMKIETLELEGDYTTVKEIKKNLEQIDPDYYLSLIYKFQDRSELFRLDMAEFEKELGKIAKATDSKAVAISVDLIVSLRKKDEKQTKKVLDRLMKYRNGNENMVSNFAYLYDRMFNEEKKTIQLLEGVNKEYFNYSVIKSLVRYFKKQDKYKKATALLDDALENLENQNYAIKSMIKLLHEQQKYKESLSYVEMALQNFPYSFTTYELKGDALLQLGKKEEAIAAYEKSLSYNIGNTSLRKKIQDLKEVEDPIEQIMVKDHYEYIAKHRNTIATNNYGINILLNDANVVLFPEGGGRYRANLIYEVTAENGIETFKEYNLGLSGNYTIIKSEIVKKDKSVVPAERSGSSFVFNGLSIGDVVYVDYESTFSGNGRFYKDYIDYFQFDSYHPTVNSSYRILVPKGMNPKLSVVNGKLPYRTEKIKDYTLHEYTLSNSNGIGLYEDYMPNSVDVVPYLHLSTIDNWNDIAIWYSDLVRANMEWNSSVQKVYDEIFPKGAAKLSENEKAKRIYYYLMDNFSYSYVSFKQSGFIPQKPAKTINTKLGDCKDFSTLYATLAKEARLTANLVLILTNDYGQNSLVLPSQDFNHCIVKVMIDGKPQFLELTDKFLPFKALPTSLRSATALEIPLKENKEETSEIFKLKDVSRERTVFKNELKVSIKDEKSIIELETAVSGNLSSFYTELFAEPNRESRNKSLESDLRNRLGGDFVVKDFNDLTHEKNGKRGNVFYTAEIDLNEKVDKIGSLNIFKMPNISNAYNNSIISLDKRQFPIEYVQYENVDEYITEYDLSLEKGKRFVEIPESQAFKFKDHSYSITYTKVSDARLKVSIKSTPGVANITSEDYPSFKKYVKDVLDAKKGLIGYK